MKTESAMNSKPARIRQLRTGVLKCISFIADADNIPPANKARIINAIHTDPVYQRNIDLLDPALPCCVGTVEEATRVRDEIVAVIANKLDGCTPRIGTVALQFD